MDAVRYYRIQPAGLGLDHRSEQSDGSFADGLHVFEYQTDTLNTDVPREMYGDEVIVIEASGHESHGDVEGVTVTGGTIVARYSWDAWVRLLAAAADIEWDGGLESWSVEDLEDELSRLDRGNYAEIGQ